MAAVVHPVAPSGPVWTENGRHASGLNNDPRKLRGMLRRLRLPGWDDPAGVDDHEANATRWTAICKAPNRETLRGNGPEYRTKWTAELNDDGSPVVMWWNPDKHYWQTEPPRPKQKRVGAPTGTSARGNG